MSDNEDRRSRRSRRALWQALMALMQDNDWAAISVQMICDGADVARSTFYAHYQTKQDLLDEGFAEVEAQLSAPPGKGGLAATITWLVQHLESASNFHRRLQGSTAGHAIMGRFRRLMRERIAKDLTEDGIAASSHNLDFAVGGMFALLEGWLASGRREDPVLIGAELTRLVRQATGYGA